MSTTPDPYSKSQQTSQNQRQAKLDETEARIAGRVITALVEFVEKHISNGAVVNHSWHVWTCHWQQDTGDVTVFLDCEGQNNDCYLLVSYLPSIKTSGSYSESIDLIDQQMLANLCLFMQKRTGLLTRQG